MNKSELLNILEKVKLAIKNLDSKKLYVGNGIRRRKRFLRLHTVNGSEVSIPLTFIKFNKLNDYWYLAILHEININKQGFIKYTVDSVRELFEAKIKH